MEHWSPILHEPQLEILSIGRFLENVNLHRRDENDQDKKYGHDHESEKPVKKSKFVPTIEIQKRGDQCLFLEQKNLSPS